MDFKLSAYDDVKVQNATLNLSLFKVLQLFVMIIFILHSQLCMQSKCKAKPKVSFTKCSVYV